MTKDDGYTETDFNIEELKVSAETLSKPLSANAVQVTHIGGNMYVDFGYIEPLKALHLTDRDENLAIDLIARVVISEGLAVELVSRLVNTLSHFPQIENPYFVKESTEEE